MWGFPCGAVVKNLPAQSTWKRTESNDSKDDPKSWKQNGENKRNH